jgi:hypothetical protein
MLWPAIVLVVHALAERQDDAVLARINPACCAYPEHDPRDYDYPYSHLLYSEVVPDVLGSFVPMTELTITYESDRGHCAVAYGKPIAPRWLELPPSVAFTLDPDRNESTLHMLMMVDPDVPFRDAAADGQRVHWLVYDIPGNRTSRGRTLVEYAGVRPRSCSESDDLCLKEHRVTFALWEQPYGPLRLHAEDVPIAAGVDAGRIRYKASDFASRHQLGLQLAMNFFETWHDERPLTTSDPPFGQMPWWHVTDAEAFVQRQQDDKGAEKIEL